MFDHTEKRDYTVWYLENNSHGIQSSMFRFVCLISITQSIYDVRHTLDHKVAVMPKKPVATTAWNAPQAFEKFISTIHKLYNTAHICLLWNSKSNWKFQFTNYSTEKSITF